MPPFSWVLFSLFLAYISGILLSGIDEVTPGVGFFCYPLFLILAVLFLRRRIFFIFLICSVISLGFLRFEVEKSKEIALEKFAGYRETAVEGYLSSIPQRKDERLKFSIQLLEVEGDKINAPLSITVYCDYTPSIEPGDYLSLEGDFRKVRNNIVFLAENHQVISRVFSIKRYIYRVKKYASNRITELYPESYACFVKATILGEVGKNIQNIRGRFQRLGLAHILAISGLHVGLVLFFFLFLLKNIGVRRRIRSIVLAVIMLGYMFLTGARPPVERATVMALIYIYFWFFYIRVNPFNVLIFTAFVMILANPATLFQASFLLSFAAMSGIFIVFYSFGNKGNKLFKYFKVALGAWLFVAPLSWFYFKGIASFGLPLNIVFLPLFSFLIACVFSSIMVSFISITAAKFFAYAAYPIFYVLFKTLDNFSKVSFCFLKLPQASIWGVIAVYGILIIIILKLSGIIRKRDRISASKNVLKFSE